MTSEEKAKLIELGNEMNSGDLDINKRVAFCDYVLEKIDTFDIEAWSIYTNIEDILNLNKDPRFINYYSEVLKRLGDTEDSIALNFVFQDWNDMLRLSLFRAIIDSYINKLNNNGN